MRFGLYKTNRGGDARNLQIRALASEYKTFDLGRPDGWKARIESDTLIVERAEAFGKHFVHDGNHWRLSTSLRSNRLIPSTAVPTADLGSPGDAILMMVKLAPFVNRPFRARTVHASPVRHIEPPAFPNAKIMRKVHELLGDYFLEKQHRYLGGWSDEKVAAEAHCSLEFVKRQREEAYGPISVVQTDLDRIISRLKEVVQELEQHSIKQGARQ